MLCERDIQMKWRRVNLTLANTASGQSVFSFQCHISPSLVHNCLWTDVNNMVTLVAGIYYAGQHAVYFPYLIRRLHT